MTLQLQKYSDMVHFFYHFTSTVKFKITQAQSDEESGFNGFYKKSDILLLRNKIFFQSLHFRNVNNIGKFWKSSQWFWVFDENLVHSSVLRDVSKPHWFKILCKRKPSANKIPLTLLRCQEIQTWWSTLDKCLQMWQWPSSGLEHKIPTLLDPTKAWVLLLNTV